MKNAVIDHAGCEAYDSIGHRICYCGDWIRQLGKLILSQYTADQRLIQERIMRDFTGG